MQFTWALTLAVPLTMQTGGNDSGLAIQPLISRIPILPGRWPSL